jgi:hypothetical protein
MIVRPYEYIIGRQNGRFPEPTDPLLFRKDNKKLRTPILIMQYIVFIPMEFITTVVILRRIIIILTNM